METCSICGTDKDVMKAPSKPAICRVCAARVYIKNCKRFEGRRQRQSVRPAEASDKQMAFGFV